VFADRGRITGKPEVIDSSVGLVPINAPVVIRSASEEEIIAAMRTVWERMKIIIEPSSAVAIAPLLKPGTVATLDLPTRPDAAPAKARRNLLRRQRRPL
jgi:threonine synthase